ncbi:MAG: YdcF family protein [Leptolyngbyaceae cyanobacterium bins.59]|nr:YdcF family protein [Leptolyngbyaceae cyanobacterium bins.59]
MNRSFQVFPNRHRRNRLCRLLLIGLCLLLVIPSLRLFVNLGRLVVARNHPTEALLVLGGSIRREIYAAELTRQYPQIPILISRGSPDPCVVRIFQNAPIAASQVWLEKCARSTFENFAYSAAILHQWKVRRITLITSQTHLPRALWLARIMLGSQGIWVDLTIAQERGIPANQESFLKTGLDLVRSVGWAFLSQIYLPHCSNLLPLSEVRLQDWEGQGYFCERITWQKTPDVAEARDG